MEWDLDGVILTLITVDGVIPTTEITGQDTIMVTGMVTMTATTGVADTIHTITVIIMQGLMIPMELLTEAGHQGTDTTVRMNLPAMQVTEIVVR
jgi:hypothetical protein